MSDQEQSIFDKKITRRKFLKGSKDLIIAGTVGAATGSTLGYILGKIFPPQKHQPKGNYEPEKKAITLTKEQEKMLEEVVLYRQKLGLDGLPSYFERPPASYEKWQEEKEIEVDLPENIKSYGLRIKEVLETMFGSKASFIVRKITQQAELPNLIAFSSNDRSCLLPGFISDIPLFPDFTDYILHEACGHGSDPVGMNPQYPLDILIKIAHGQWRSLSQAFSIENQFFHHPGDLTYPRVKRRVGKELGLLIKAGKASEFIKGREVGILLSRIAEEEGKSVKTLKFRKMVCQKIGQGLLDLYRQGKIDLPFEIKKRYQEEIEGACVEIYAEMVKYAIIYPDLISHNSDIIEGIGEMISSISGRKTELVITRENINHPSQEIIARNVVEKQMIIAGMPEKGGPIELTGEEIALFKEQDEERKRKDLAYNSFAQFGTLPESFDTLSKPIRAFIQEFAGRFSLVAGKYPVLKEFFLSPPEFDPDLDIWEIEKIEEAMQSSFVRQLLENSEFVLENIKEIKEKSEVLEKFIQSGAFQ